MKRTILPLLAFSLLITLPSAPAFAKKPHQPPAPAVAPVSEEEFSHENRTNWGRHGQDFDGVTFDEDERDSIITYLHEEHQRKCPPGLAKKHKRCTPPGQSKKYVIGGPLPTKHQTLPLALIERLGPPPAGTFYAIVDNDVVLAVEGTKKVLDAVTLFSAMGQE